MGQSLAPIGHRPRPCLDSPQAKAQHPRNKPPRDMLEVSAYYDHWDEPGQSTFIM
jgi:hypothetical protein